MTDGTYTFHGVAGEQAEAMMQNTTNEVSTMRQEQFLAQIKAQVQDWAGGGREAFDVAQQQFDASTRQMEQALSAARSALGEIRMNIATGDSRAASAWSGIS